jgi:rhodanese-related sulfurtransferase
MSGEKPRWVITSEELEPLLGQVLLVDVREPEEFAESRIEVARADRFKLIPLSEFSSRVEREIPDHDEDVVLYCAHGVRSMHALMAMARLGYERVRSLEGGICAWEERRPKAGR